MTGNNPNLELSISMYIQNLVNFIKVLSGNETLKEILTSVKGHNSVIIVGKMM